MNKIQIILTSAKEQQWPYPKMFEALKEAGVTSYAVEFARGHGFDASYEGTFGVFKEPVPGDYTTLEATEKFDADKVLQALKNRMNKLTTYTQFLGELAASGVTHYLVDMQKRTVTYFNGDETEFYVQNVPTL